MGNLNFDATQVSPDQGGGGGLPVSGPEGHAFGITNTEVKPTKDNDGGYLQLNLTIIDGPCQGQGGAYRLNLYNKEPKAVEIAYKQLSALCHATGRFQLANHEDLRGATFRGVVGLQKGAVEGGYTEIKKILDMQGNEPGKAPVNQPAAAPAWQAPGAPVAAAESTPAAAGWQATPQPAAAPWGAK